MGLLFFFLVNPTKIICGSPQKSQKNHLEVGVSVNTRFKKNIPIYIHEFDEFLLLFFRDWYWHQKEIEHRLFNLCETMAPPPLLSHHQQVKNTFFVN